MKRVLTSSIVASAMFAVVAGNWALATHADNQTSATPPSGAAPACCAGETAGKHGIAFAHTLTLDGAHRVLEAALAAARERTAGGAIAIVDAGGNAILVERLDGTFPAATTVSLGKARTAALFRKPTKSFEDAINGGRTALAAVGELTPLQGGVPIVHEGQVVGAIGVSGAHNQAEDEQIAMAGASAIQEPATSSTNK